MQLNEIVEENTLPTISQRTRIVQENLKALVDRDWDRLKRVQALGFISILEREYGIDLSSLRQECRSHFENQEPSQERKKISVTSEEVAYAGRRRIFKGFVFFLLVLFAYASWHFFVAKNPTLENNTSLTSLSQKQSFYDSALKVAQAWFGSKATVDSGGDTEATKGAWAEEKNDTAQAASKKSRQVSKMEEEQRGTELPKPKEMSLGDSLERSSLETSEQEEAKIIEKVKAEQAMKETGDFKQPSAEEPKKSDQATKEKGAAANEISQMIAAATPEMKNATLETTTPSMRAESKKRSSERSSKKQESISKKQQSSSAAEEKSSPAAMMAKVLFHPFKKIWVGYTNLRTMKREAKVTSSEIPFDTSKGDYILATGHGIIEFRNAKGALLKLNDGQRHFFMIAKGGVRKISHDAFQRLNKSKVW